MEKEDYIKLRESVRKEIMYHVERQDSYREGKEQTLRLMINDMRSNIQDLRNMVMSYLFTTRDRENALIEECDMLRSQIIDIKKEAEKEY